MTFVVMYNKNGNICQLNFRDYTVAKNMAIEMSRKNGSADLNQVDSYGTVTFIAMYKNGEKW